MPTTVYGYICLEDDDEPTVDRLHDQLTGHAAAEGMALAEVFIDRNMPPARIVRPGLTVLLEVVGRIGGCGVLRSLHLDQPGARLYCISDSVHLY